MLLTKFKDEGYLFNVNFTGTFDGSDIYRGDLVLEFGEVTERGDRKPPSVVAKQAVILITDDNIRMLVAGLDKLSDLAMVTEHYEQYMTEDCQLLFFVHDIKNAFIVPISGRDYKLEGLDDGMIWNEALELLCIEKSDLKGQSSEEKVVTLFDELCQFKSKGSTVNYDEALTKTIEVKASARGPV